MKNYKDFEKMYIGRSDSAYLTVAEYGIVDDITWHELKFGEDGDYSAYICWGDLDIGEHYKKVLELHKRITIVDDDIARFDAEAENIDIYRAGDFGCVIHLQGNHIMFGREDIQEYYTVINGKAVAK